VPVSKEHYSRRYEQLRSIGEGAYGAVFLVRSKRSLSPAAPEFAAKEPLERTEKARQGFAREFDVMKGLCHPHCVKTIQFLEWCDAEGEEPRMWMVSELAAGGDLSCYVQQMYASIGSLKEQWVRKVMWQSTCGIAYLHHKEIVHNDIKPENVLVMEPFNLSNPNRVPTVAIADFSCATQSLELRFRCGDPRYRCPEAWRMQMLIEANKQVDMEAKLLPCSDVFMLGVTGFELLSGGIIPFVYVHNATLDLHNLFGNEGLRHKIQDMSEVRIYPYLGERSAQAQDFIRLAVRKDHERRPESASELLRHEWLASDEPPARSDLRLGVQFTVPEGRVHAVLLNALAREVGREHWRTCWAAFQRIGHGGAAHGAGITLEQLRSAAPRMGLGCSSVDEAFREANVTGSGSLNFVEFLAVTFDWSSLEPAILDSYVLHLFSLIDQDGHGHIDKIDLVNFLSGKASPSLVRSAFLQMDRGNNGWVFPGQLQAYLLGEGRITQPVTCGLKFSHALDACASRLTFCSSGHAAQPHGPTLLTGAAHRKLGPICTASDWAGEMPWTMEGTSKFAHVI